MSTPMTMSHQSPPSPSNPQQSTHHESIHPGAATAASVAEIAPVAGNGTMFQYNATFSEEDITDILSRIGHDAPAPSLLTGQIPSTNDSIESEVSLEQKAAARSERKRSREKQRRSDVNKHFADLTALLRKIESEDEEGDPRLPLNSGTPTNRVDLLNRTISVLERCHEKNKKRKREIEDLNQKLAEANKMAEDTAARLKEATFYQHPQKQVMMMVPMMVSQGHMQNGGGGAATAPASFSMMPHMPMMPSFSSFQQQSQPPSAGAASSAPSGMMPMMSPLQMFSPQMAQQPTPAPSQTPPHPLHPQQQLQAVSRTQDQQQLANQQAQHPPNQGDGSNSSNESGGNLAHCA